MVAILSSDGDGYDIIIAIVSDKKYVSKFIKENTGFKDVGYVEANYDIFQEYWCYSFDKDAKGVILAINE